MLEYPYNVLADGNRGIISSGGSFRDWVSLLFLFRQVRLRTVAHGT